MSAPISAPDSSPRRCSSRNPDPGTRTPIRFLAACIILLATAIAPSHAATTDPPPDPGLEASIIAADCIVDAEIVAGGPFRALAQTRKVLKGQVPPIFELEGYNSFNWDTVHRGFEAGSRFVLFLSKTGKPDVFVPLTPATPRLKVQQEGVLIALGDPPFRIPVKPAAFEEGVALLLEKAAGGAVPEGATKYLRKLWEDGDIEARYLSVAMAGALRDPRAAQLVVDGSRDKLLKLRLTAIEAMGKIASPETFATLRALLKDEKTAVSRAAAGVLLDVQDVDSLPDLLDWVRKTIAASKKVGVGAGAKADPAKAKLDAAIINVVRFAGAAGATLEPGKLTRSLLDIARTGSSDAANEALESLGKYAGTAEIDALIELADDPIYDAREKALAILQRVTLIPAKDADDFRARWKTAAKNFGEGNRRDLAEKAAKAMVDSDDYGERRALQDLLKTAPGEVSIVSAAPLLLNGKTSVNFSGDDLAVWNSALAVPFLIERLGRESSSQRQEALKALIKLCEQHPRLRQTMWPLIRAGQVDSLSGYRNSALAASATLRMVEGINALVHTVRYHSSYDAQDASKAIYSLSARTFGFSIYEPQPDQNAARARLRGWWADARTSFVSHFQLSYDGGGPLPEKKLRAFQDLEGAARTAKLSELAMTPDSRFSVAGFTLLFGESGAASPVWKSFLEAPRQRDKVHGILGTYGGEGQHLAALKKILADEKEHPLCRTHALIALATQRSGDTTPGADAVMEWLAAHGKETEFPLRRAGAISLAFLDGHAKSLEWLETTLKACLEAPVPDNDGYYGDEPTDDYALMRSVLIALCARKDGSALLQKIVEEAKDWRAIDTAARALAVRRHESAVVPILKATEKMERARWFDLCRSADGMLTVKHLPDVLALLDSAETPARSAGAWLLANRPEIGNDADTRGKLLQALTDDSSVVRYYCAEALGKRKATSALSKLVELLSDADDDVRSAAAEAIGMIGDVEACQAAAVAFERQFRPDMRWLKAIAIAGNAEHIAQLQTLASSNMYAEQRAGLEAMAHARTAEAFQRVLKTYRDDNAPLQTLAGDLLIKKGDAIVEALQEDLKSTKSGVRARALHLLGGVNSENARAILKATAANENEEAGLRAIAEFLLKRSESKPR